MKDTFSTHLIRALVLSLPLVGLYLAHFAVKDLAESKPTGLIQYDMAYYLANARQYVDGEHSFLFYSNPYDHSPESPRIYFQPLTLLLSFFLYLVPAMPAVPFLILGGLFTVAAFYVLSGLVEELCPTSSLVLRNLLVLAVAWGGGCLTLQGVLWSLASGQEVDPLRFDPSQGMWFLNLGRNFTYPTEALYHLLVLAMFLAIFRGKKPVALALVWLLVLSHPFTGLQYSLILFSWALFEHYFLRSELFTRRNVLTFAVPVFLCVSYYLLFLPLFPSHRSLVEQWSFDWSIKLPAILGAYGVVGLLAWYRCRTKERFVECFSSPFNRFLGVAFFLSFILANHEFFLSPRQPIHFTRGHVWTPLLLLGLPVLVGLWERWRKRRLVVFLAALLFLPLFLLDNIVFFWATATQPQGIQLTESHYQAFATIRESGEKPIVFSENPIVAYVSATYSPARPYLGHWANTPERDRKAEAVDQFFSDGTVPPDLAGHDFWVLTERYQRILRRDVRFHEVFTGYRVSIFSCCREVGVKP